MTIITENSLYTNPTERAALVKDKKRAMDALLINFFGFLGLYKLSDSRGYMKTYETTEGKLMLNNIGDNNHDVSLSIKLAHEAGVLLLPSVNVMTKLLVLIKGKQIKGKDLDEQKVRDILQTMNIGSHQPDAKILTVFNEFISGSISLALLAKDLFIISKQPNFTSISVEYRNLVAKGQYNDFFSKLSRTTVAPVQTTAPATNNTTTTAKAQPVKANAGFVKVDRYVNTTGTSNKFWAGTTYGKDLITMYGSMNSAGSISVKTLPTEADARKALATLMLEKGKKGYIVNGTIDIPTHGVAASTPDPVAVNKPTPAPSAPVAKIAPKPAPVVKKGVGDEFYIAVLDGTLDKASMDQLFKDYGVAKSTLNLPNMLTWVKSNRDKFPKWRFNADKHHSPKGHPFYTLAKTLTKYADLLVELSIIWYENSYKEIIASNSFEPLLDIYQNQKEFFTYMADVKTDYSIHGRMKPLKDKMSDMAWNLIVEKLRNITSADQAMQGIIPLLNNIYVTTVRSLSPITNGEGIVIKSTHPTLEHFKLTYLCGYKPWSPGSQNLIGYKTGVKIQMQVVDNKQPENESQFIRAYLTQHLSKDEFSVEATANYRTATPSIILDTKAQQKLDPVVMAVFKLRPGVEFLDGGPNAFSVSRVINQVINCIRSSSYNRILNTNDPSIWVNTLDLFDRMSDVQLKEVEKEADGHNELPSVVIRELATTYSDFIEAYNGTTIFDPRDQAKAQQKYAKFVIGVYLRAIPGRFRDNFQSIVPFINKLIANIPALKDEIKSYFFRGLETVTIQDLGWKSSYIADAVAKSFPDEINNSAIGILLPEIISNNDNKNKPLQFDSSDFKDSQAWLNICVKVATEDMDDSSEIAEKYLLAKRQTAMRGIAEVSTGMYLGDVMLIHMIVKDQQVSDACLNKATEMFADAAINERILANAVDRFAAKMQGHWGTSRKTAFPEKLRSIMSIIMNRKFTSIKRPNITDLIYASKTDDELIKELNDGTMHKTLTNSEFSHKDSGMVAGVAKQLKDKMTSKMALEIVKIFDALFKDKQTFDKSNRDSAINTFVQVMFDLHDVNPKEADKFMAEVKGEIKRHMLDTATGFSLMDDMKDKLYAKESLVRPLFQLDANRIQQVLAYNNISIPTVRANSIEGQSITHLKKVVKKFSEEVSYPRVTKTNPDDKNRNEYLERKSVEYDRFNRYRHGQIAVKFLDEFDVNIAQQVKGFEEFRKSKPGTEVIRPAFHGTGSVAASMILRFGFAVIKSNDSSVVGRMLGDGIYFSTVLDKVSQYVSDHGYTRGKGTKGYIFQMEAALGEKNKDYRAAGLGSDAIKSPEWCVFTPNKQLKIVKAYLVEIIEKSEMDRMKSKYSVAESIMKIETFKEFINEASTPEMSHTTTFVFMDGMIPTGKTTRVDFEDWTSPSGKVRMEPSGMGPMIIIDHDGMESESFCVNNTQTFMQDEFELDKFLGMVYGNKLETSAE